MKAAVGAYMEARIRTTMDRTRTAVVVLTKGERERSRCQVGSQLLLEILDLLSEILDFVRLRFYLGEYQRQKRTVGSHLFTTCFQSSNREASSTTVPKCKHTSNLR
jgi:hypothetical protein